MIGSIPGVMDCVVCGTEKGPAAAVVLLKGAEGFVTREVIHSVVKCKYLYLSLEISKPLINDYFHYNTTVLILPD